ncbi:uncharacterized protein LOC132737636 isoform X1 [Ruditapes philippinarum]|uniref:uncharacterized protein LOC132737636 isoform X1 n=1 Tax=Ruditapes philippinarum TaxID=129788 RepID=UPI00295B964A|nr:uncharacterized protein LOC132737636 isoform X1 [Ruditapes philippinarum]
MEEKKSADIESVSKQVTDNSSVNNGLEIDSVKNMEERKSDVELKPAVGDTEYENKELLSATVGDCTANSKAGNPDCKADVLSIDAGTYNVVPSSGEESKDETPFTPSAGSAVSRRAPHLHKLEKKHSSGDLHSRLKTRKLLGVGETDDGDVHRSKLSQILGHSDQLYIRLPSGLRFWQIILAVVFSILSLWVSNL